MGLRMAAFGRRSSAISESRWIPIIDFCGDIHSAARTKTRNGETKPQKRPKRTKPRIKQAQTKPRKQPKKYRDDQNKKNETSEICERVPGTTTDGPKKPSSLVCLFSRVGRSQKQLMVPKDHCFRKAINNKRVVSLPVTRLIQRKQTNMFVLLLRAQLPIWALWQ